MVPFGVACGADAESAYLQRVNLPDSGAESTLDDAGSETVGKDASKPTYTYDGGIDNSQIDPDAACAAASLNAEQVVVETVEEVVVETQVPAPVLLYVLFDRSQSMSLSLWTPAVRALKAFVNDTDSAGMDIALQYFPNGGSCNGTGYSTPAVAPGRLPAAASAISTSLNNQSPAGIGTPIEGALRGATQYCKNYQAANGVQCVAVVVTDGKPEWDTCEKNSDDLAKIASDAKKNDDVTTFAVGLSGADFALLDKIAVAGGAADCDPSGSRFSCDVSSSADALSTALAKIRDTVTKYDTHTETKTETVQRPLECTWSLPAAKDGVAVDKSRVNVSVGGGAGPTLQLGRVADESSCALGAWYYDDANNPTQVVACPQTCEAIKAASYTDVKILLGCETVLVI